MLLGCGSAKSKFPCSSRLQAAKGLAGTSGGGPKMSFPVISLLFDSEMCFFILASTSLSRVPLSSRCLATSGGHFSFRAKCDLTYASYSLLVHPQSSFVWRICSTRTSLGIISFTGPNKYSAPSHLFHL
uniref:Uncharacterized protein n=1 Tax=Arundo donax TaxID=35708 RepID=A0A0A9CSF0_ARUDO